jgi:hypothetical protein
MVSKEGFGRKRSAGENGGNYGKLRQVGRDSNLALPEYKSREQTMMRLVIKNDLGYVRRSSCVLLNRIKQ